MTTTSTTVPRRFLRRSTMCSKFICFVIAVVIFMVILYNFDITSSIPEYMSPSGNSRNPLGIIDNTSSTSVIPDLEEESEVPLEIINGTDKEDLAQIPAPILGPDLEEFLEGSDLEKLTEVDKTENQFEKSEEGEPENDKKYINESIILTTPLPLPYVLKKQFSVEQLASLAPKDSSCPPPPWGRNLTEHPVLVVGHQTNFGFSHEGTKLEGCPWSCVFTNNLERTGEADAHFYSVLRGGIPMSGGTIQDRGGENERKCPLQRFVFWSMESEANYPGINDLKTAGFDIAMTYRTDSDVPSVYFSNNEYNFSKTPISFGKKNATTAIASAFISNCSPKNNRFILQGDLQNILPIDSFGACHHTQVLQVEAGLSKWKIKAELLPKYLFTLAFENSNSQDYVTEKMYQALEAGTVPVFLGTDTVRNFVPQNSIINVADFDSTEALVEHLLYLRSHPKEYAKYLTWKREGIRGPWKESLDKTKLSDRCRLCGVISGEDVGW